MSTFIEDVVSDLQKRAFDFSKLVFILPSRRAGTLLQKTIASQLTQTIFSPTIYSIEEFIQNISGLQAAPAIELVFKFYEAYLNCTSENEQESFQSFISWAPSLLDDINEIDRHILKHSEIFDHLNAIQELDHWSKTATTDLIKNYLAFWKKLPFYYEALSEKLLAQNEGHQGLLYRKASEEIEFYINNNSSSHHVFLGFNALNTAEERIIQALLANGNSSIYWDAEKHFMQIPNHNASVFLNKHKSNWKHFAKKDFNWITSHFNQKKDINCTGVPQNIDQVKYVSNILASLDEKALKNTAIVLGDESIIIPLINSLPSNVKDVNITMGVPLSQTPIASYFENLFKLQLTVSTKGYYYKNVLAVLKHPVATIVLGQEIIESITKHITVTNSIYVSYPALQYYFTDENEASMAMFEPWDNSIGKALKSTSQLISITLNETSLKEDALLIEYLQGFKKAFFQLETLCNTYSYIDDIKVLERFYNDIVAKEVVDLRGNPHKGLQIMGMLESRLLDFETVIITSVNEGVLPSGKTSSSYLPFDLKLHYGLPTYADKDAVYTYHFYRLLHRARKIEILYTSSNSGLGSSEKSRLIHQLEADGVHSITHQIAASPIKKIAAQVQSIVKTPAVQVKIKSFLSSGISPSAIGTYLRNPLDFYYQYILRVSAPDAIEETIASNTMGTIIHNVLERLYKPFLKQQIHSKDIKTFRDSFQAHVDDEFKRAGTQNIVTGRNRITYEVICRYIDNFLKMERSSLENGAIIQIHSLENKLKAPLANPSLPYEVSIKGTVDRIDIYNNEMRIIDYKTGTVEPRQLRIKEWEDLLAPEAKYEKAFQILLYTLMVNKTIPLSGPVSAGIISTKKIQNGYMPFTMNRNSGIDQEMLTSFEAVLVQLLQEIINPDIPFIDSGFSY